MRKKRVVLIVLDSVGVGALPDAGLFGDEGADTVGHLIETRGLRVPNLEKLGLLSLDGTSFKRDTGVEITGCYGKCAQAGMAKDTTSGHWEMSGYIRNPPFRTFPGGFPDEIIREFEGRIGRSVLGNRVASGTEIIQELGDEHMRTQSPIVYTSADSVFQIAAHESVIAPEALYEMCRSAREMLTGEWSVGRVIARPFTGESGGYVRTKNRRDFSVSPEQPTILDAISESGMDVVAIGKIEDIFNFRGITRSVHTTDNAAGIVATMEAVRADTDGLIFTNLVDFDMLYGHRNNAEGYALAIEAFDDALPGILGALRDDDLLIITADHGCDPLFPGTDHTREYIPLLVYGKQIRKNINLGIRSTFADIGATAVDWLGLETWPVGTSFFAQIIPS